MVIAPALCRKQQAEPNASKPHAVRNSAPPRTARSTFGWLRDALMWSDDMIACPTKNEAKQVIRPVTKATTANTTAFAAIISPRRGIVVSVVRIMPVEYSDEMTSTPSTPMTSWLM